MDQQTACACMSVCVCLQLLAFIHWCISIHVRACQCVGNKEIRHREGAFKSSPTSQCHSNSLHLTQRNHNRGSGGIPHWHMTDGSRLKGNSTLKLILCTGGIHSRYLLFYSSLCAAGKQIDFSANT